MANLSPLNFVSLKLSVAQSVWSNELQHLCHSRPTLLNQHLRHFGRKNRPSQDENSTSTVHFCRLALESKIVC
jgi:hypothetical protein